MRPRIAVFYGGEAANHDLSMETGTWVCQYVPRGEYDITPIEVTSQGKWKVPLGNLPRSGSVTTTLKRLSEAVKPVIPAEGINRLLSRPIDGVVTVVRGHGGDDGALHSFGSLINAAVAGSPLAACQQTSDKYAFNQSVSDIVNTPYTQRFSKKMSVDSIVSEIQEDFLPPLFLKPATQEGSFGIEHVESPHQLKAAVSRIVTTSDLIAQEALPGTEYAVSVAQDERGKIHTLPSVAVHPTKASFYDHLAKRRDGRVQLHTADHSPITEELEEIAQEIYEELGCRGVVTMDFVVNGDDISILEANTVPTLSSHTPLVQQLKAGGLHPSILLGNTIRRSLEER
ncbi:MAG: ATP-grasp domain-containing protein [Candidatus Andersenbacteria bacterium]|nr:ATP-grasp domain-containing protein [Candidatus Andersenbacteria bacterium]